MEVRMGWPYDSCHLLLAAGLYVPPDIDVDRSLESFRSAR